VSIEATGVIDTVMTGRSTSTGVHWWWQCDSKYTHV